jgi:iron complex outermembrane receptor protein
VRNVFNVVKPVSSSYTPSIGAYYLNLPDPQTVLVSLRFSE